LYSRFWHKVLYDRGYVPCVEPFQKLVNQGMILGEPEYHVSSASWTENHARLAELHIAGAHRPSEAGSEKDDTYALKIRQDAPHGGGERLVNVRPKRALDTFVLLLAPYAPHIAEELWATLAHPHTLVYEPWPGYDQALTKADEIEIPVQVNGKVRAKLMVAADIDDAALEAAALADAKVQEFVAGKPVKMVKVVPKRLVSVVVG
jgi:leucyl-tRNA synthetase